MQSVTVIEIMGRNAGWLTGAAVLAKSEDCEGPDLIYLPEVAFDVDDFLKKVKKLVSEKQSSKKEQAHLHILANRISLSGELYRDNWIGKRATEAANAIAKERNFVQSQDIGKANKAEIKEAMNSVLKKMQGFDLTKFQEELGKLGFKVREARASTGKLNGYYVTARSGTEYKASEIGKGYTLAHIERTQSKLKYNSMNISHGNKLTSGKGGFHL